MKKILVFLFSALLLCSSSLMAQERFYNEVYTISDFLNSYDGSTCIISGTITGYDNSHHKDRYILKYNSGEISIHIPHHVKGNHKNILGSTSKIFGEIRDSLNHHNI